MKRTELPRGVKRLAQVFSIALLFVLGSCGLDQGYFDEASTNARGKADEWGQDPANPRAKYIFLLIGDGMGFPQLHATEVYRAQISSTEINPIKLRLTQLPAKGRAATHSSDTFITDSAAAGTALACGRKTNMKVISMDPTGQEKYKTIAEVARDAGKRVGIVSSVSIDHATPAAFYAHAPSRKHYYAIAAQAPASGFNYFGGGGFKRPDDSGKQKHVEQLAQENGYTIAKTRAEFEALSAGSPKVIATSPDLDSSKALPFAIDRQGSNAISLAEFTRKGIELLDNPNGFFMMVEGGKIDWASHANDGASTIQEVLAFDDAVAEALAFYEKHPNETLIVVTADHETGGMVIGHAGTGGAEWDGYVTYLDLLQSQKMSNSAFQEGLEQFKQNHTKRDADGNILDQNGAQILADGQPIHYTDRKAKGKRVIEAQLDQLAGKIQGAFGLVFSGDANNPLLLNDHEKSELQEAFQESMADKNYYKKSDVFPGEYELYGGYSPLTVMLVRILNNKAGLGWTTYSHSALPAPVFAQGVGAELFDDDYDNTDINYIMRNVMGLQ